MFTTTEYKSILYTNLVEALEKHRASLRAMEPMLITSEPVPEGLREEYTYTEKTLQALNVKMNDLYEETVRKRGLEVTEAEHSDLEVVRKTLRNFFEKNARLRTEYIDAFLELVKNYIRRIKADATILADSTTLSRSPTYQLPHHRVRTSFSSSSGVSEHTTEGEGGFSSSEALPLRPRAQSLPASHTRTSTFENHPHAHNPHLMTPVPAEPIGDPGLDHSESRVRIRSVSSMLYSVVMTLMGSFAVLGSLLFLLFRSTRRWALKRFGREAVLVTLASAWIIFGVLLGIHFLRRARSLRIPVLRFGG